MTIDRRAALTALGAIVVGGCRRDERTVAAVAPAVSEPPSPVSPSPAPSASAAPAVSAASLSDELELLDWSFPPGNGAAERVTVLLPKKRAATDRFPLLVALHGRGEATRGAEAGAYGWIRDYKLPKTIAAVSAGKLARDDFAGFVDDARLAKLNAALAEHPFAGLVIACPHTPDVLAQPKELAMARPFGDWLARTLVPKLRAETPVTDAAGIDGVSLGGRVSLVAGLEHPEAFRAVGTLQPAIQGAEAPALVERARAFFAANPRGSLRLLSSDRDFFLEPVHALDAALTAAKLPHEELVIKGPHDYVFNRGPGAIEMLVWHDRVLRGLPPV